MDTSPRVALVTGAGTGIGRAVALAFLQNGYNVVLAGRRAEPLLEVAAEAGPLGARALVVPADVTQPESVQALFSQTRKMKAQDPRGGRIINNGSISAHAPRPDSAPYTAAKPGITGLTRSTSLDGRKYDIACGRSTSAMRPPR